MSKAENLERPEDGIFISSASFVGFRTIANGIRGKESRDRAIDETFAWTRKQGFKPEIYLFPWMPEKPEPFKMMLTEKGIVPPYAFHLPKHCGWDIGELGELASRLAHKDFSGFLFFSPARIGTISPKNEADFIKLLDELFDKNRGFLPEECLAVTVHDGTIIDGNDRTGKPLVLNKIGQRLAEKAKQGHRVGVELAFEGSRLPVGCPTASDLEEFLRLCQRNGFGLTLDIHNIWQIVAQSGGTFEYFPVFLKKIIDISKGMGVPIYMVHFNPFNISKNGAHLSPSDCSISLGWLRSFMEVNGMADVPVSLETNGAALANGLDLKETPNQQMLQTILRPYVY